MSAAVSAMLLAVAVVVLVPRGGLGWSIDTDREVPADEASVKRRWIRIAAALAGLATAALAGGGILGVVLGGAVALVATRVLGRLAGAVRIDEVALQRQAADAAELIAACLMSGATLERTTDEVARSMDEPMAALLRDAAALMAMGAAPETAWQGLGEHEATAPIARTIVRAVTSGAPGGEALMHTAADLRNRRQAAAQTQVRSVAIASVGPLGLCFLPAFVLLGVVPVVASLISSGAG